MNLLQRIQQLEEAIGIDEVSYSRDEVLLELGDSLKEKFYKYNLEYKAKRGSRIIKFHVEKLRPLEIRKYLDEFERQKRVELKLILLGKSNFEVIKIK